jgi:hypothetical protein
MSEMRQYKFRAWTGKQMDYDYRDACLWNGILVAEGDTLLMQFTSIKDKTGRDIYEGDIVQYDAIGVQGTVTWSATHPGFIILNPEKTGAFVIHEDWEVIGNIYESELPA